ncbi:hypothetical protein KI387_030112, partial [Taxus chinensis]
DVLEVNVEVDLMDWEADGLAMEVMAVVGMEEAFAVEVVMVLVSGGIDETMVVAK